MCMDDFCKAIKLEFIKRFLLLNLLFLVLYSCSREDSRIDSNSKGKVKGSENERESYDSTFGNGSRLQILIRNSDEQLIYRVQSAKGTVKELVLFDALKDFSYRGRVRFEPIRVKPFGSNLILIDNLTTVMILETDPIRLVSVKEDRPKAIDSVFGQIATFCLNCDEPTIIRERFPQKLIDSVILSPLIDIGGLYPYGGIGLKKVEFNTLGNLYIQWVVTEGELADTILYMSSK